MASPMIHVQAELAVLGSLCGFSQDSEVLPEWTADGLELLENLHRQLTTAELRSAPLLQRLFQGAYQPFGEALAEWLFHGEARPHPNSPFAAELPSDLRDLLPERCQPEVGFRLVPPIYMQSMLPPSTKENFLWMPEGWSCGAAAQLTCIVACILQEMILPAYA